MNLTSCGLDLKSMLKIIALIDTDLPVPVAPATSRWGILARSVAKRRAADVFAERQRDLRIGAAIGLALNHFSQIDSLAARVGNFDTDHRLAWDRRQDAHADGAQRHGEIVGEHDDAPDFDAGRRLEFVHGDNRSGRTATTSPATPKSSSFFCRISELAWSVSLSI